MPDDHANMTTQRRTLEAMIRIFCHGRHGWRSGLCPECQELLEYAGMRLENCPFQEHKPRCSQCPVNCYKPNMRNRIRAVMKYAGPRMLFRHPVLSGVHYLTGSKKNTDMKKNRPPLRPLALMNFKKTDSRLANNVGNFWKLVWANENPAIEQKTKYLLSLANAVGASRYRQATRELIKAYAAGTTVAELDELFTLFVWNQGAGHFASEIGPSQLFAVYQLIKSQEEQGLSRADVVGNLLKNFGEDNPDVATRSQTT